jgi:hypothetical protein
VTDRTRLSVHIGLLWGLGLAALATSAAARWLGVADEAIGALAGVGLVVSGNALAAVREALARCASADARSDA